MRHTDARRLHPQQQHVRLRLWRRDRYSEGTLTLTACTLGGNSAGSKGGGIDSNSSDEAKITASTVSDNSAGTDGGGSSTSLAR